MIDQGLISQFERRRTLFNRVTAERKASNPGSLERLRLDSASAKCANRLMEACAVILAECECDMLMGKWRSRLALELSCLTIAREHLSCAMNLSTQQGGGRYVSLARNACALVRRSLKEEEDRRRISEVYEKVQRYETQAVEQLAILTAADVEMCIDTTTTKNKKKKIYELYPLYECRDFKRPLTLLLTLA